MQLEVDLARLSICFVAGTLGSGGAERQLYYMAHALKQSGATVRVLCLTTGEPWEKRLGDTGIPVTWVGRSRSKLGRLLRIVRELAARRPHIVQSQHFYTNLYAVLAGHLLHIPAIAAIRSNLVSELKANGSVLGPLSLRTPSILAANSAAGIENACRYGVSTTRLQFLPNVIDTDHFHPASVGRQPPVKLLAVGRLSCEKRFDRFLHALCLVRRMTDVPFTALIVGDGPMRTELERMAEECGLSDLLKFHGPTEEMAEIYRASDILAHTSDYEGTPNVVLEAMASGMAVVATSVGGVKDLIDHGQSGFMAPPGDDDMMAGHLRMLIETPALRARIGDSARASIEQSHSVRILPAKLSMLYARALAS